MELLKSILNLAEASPFGFAVLIVGCAFVCYCCYALLKEDCSNPENQDEKDRTFVIHVKVINEDSEPAVTSEVNKRCPIVIHAKVINEDSEHTVRSENNSHDEKASRQEKSEQVVQDAAAVVEK